MTGIGSAKRAPEHNWGEVWDGVRARVRGEIGDGGFETWISPLALRSTTGGHVRLAAPRRLIRDYVALHHGDRLERAFAALASDFASLEVVVAPAEPRIGGANAQASLATRPTPPPHTRGSGTAKTGSLAGMWDRQPDPLQTFETFVTGPSNEFAFKAAKRLAQEADTDIGLLFVHGGFGIGKTHLLNAIALESRRMRNARALFLRAEDFMRRFIGALRSQETLAFKEELRGADILLLDDLQHICGRAATISEFLHTVNAFADLRRKVVIAADRPPASLDGLTDDIRSRLKGAVVIALDKPDAQTRTAILKARAAELALRRPRAALPEAVLEHVANDLDASPRELIGVLTKLATYAELTGKPVTMEVADEALGMLTAPGGRKITIEEIQRKTAEFYKLDLKDLHSPRRARRVARPRQVAMFLARELTSRSLPEIGRRFGGRDHTTVLHACRRIEELCRLDPVFQQEVDFLRKVLGRPALV